METKYNVDYFIKKFEAIPEDRWAIRTQHDGNGNHCAFGWCRPSETLNKPNTSEFSGDATEEGQALISLFSMLYSDPSILGNIAHINNGDIAKYGQAAPKQRILAALYDIKAIQESKVEETKEKVIYQVVEVDSKVKELTKEKLILS